MECIRARGNRYDVALRFLEQIECSGTFQRLQSASDLQLAVDVVNMCFYGSERNMKFECNFFIGQPCFHKPPQPFYIGQWDLFGGTAMLILAQAARTAFDHYPPDPVIPRRSDVQSSLPTR